MGVTYSNDLFRFIIDDFIPPRWLISERVAMTFRQSACKADRVWRIAAGIFHRRDTHLKKAIMENVSCVKEEHSWVVRPDLSKDLCESLLRLSKHLLLHHFRHGLVLLTPFWSTKSRVRRMNISATMSDLNGSPGTHIGVGPDWSNASELQVSVNGVSLTTYQAKDLDQPVQHRCWKEPRE
jgi:hypothetical protein